MSVDVYTTTLAVVRASTAQQSAKLNAGGRVLLPTTVLDEISMLRIEIPFKFKITTNRSKPKHVYAGVLEFTAERGTVVLPDWMADHLNVKDNSTVKLDTCSIPGPNILKLQPHTQNFIQLKDPRVVLEQHLINYPVLTKGTAIVIHHANCDFKLTVTELLDGRMKPMQVASWARADTMATEVKLELERPLDMPPEDEEMHDIAPYEPHATQAGSPVSSVRTASGSPTGGISFSPLQYQPPSISAEEKKEEERSVIAFVPFEGRGKTLAGTSAPCALTPAQIREARLKALSKK